MLLRRGNTDLDTTAIVSCNGCDRSATLTIDRSLDWARDHHDVFDHEPYKPSTAPDTHNIFSLTAGPVILSIEVSSMFARLMSEGNILYKKQYAPSNLERII